jgi:hypothetical protein
MSGKMGRAEQRGCGGTDRQMLPAFWLFGHARRAAMPPDRTNKYLLHFCANLPEFFGLWK